MELEDKEPYHIVKCSYNDKYIGYDVYKNNKKFLFTQRGTKLEKKQAVAIMNLLNNL